MNNNLRNLLTNTLIPLDVVEAINGDDELVKVAMSLPKWLLGEKVEMRICSIPTTKAADIYSMLNYKLMPFRKIKICRTQ